MNCKIDCRMKEQFKPLYELLQLLTFTGNSREGNK